MMLTQPESNFLRHITMFGSDGYPVRKIGSKWHWTDFGGIKGAPTTYDTKREATQAIERYIDVLLDKKAGRL